MRIKLEDGITIDTRQHRYMEGSVDRHDNVRVYVRRDGRRRRICDWSSAATFMAEYRNLRDGPVPSAPARRAPAARDSIRWLCERYYDSAEFMMLADSTRRTRRWMLDAFCERHGARLFAQMERRHVRALRAEKVKAGVPEAGNSLVNTLRVLFAWAIEA